MTADCGCLKCHPERFPIGPRRNEGHIAARFGDDKDARLFAFCDVFVDGTRTGRCIEACPGADGFVVELHEGWLAEDGRLVDGYAHECPCGSGALCEVVRRGRVEVRHRSQGRDR